ncbi:hypothetical protein D3C71_681630 [compost metagenome]
MSSISGMVRYGGTSVAAVEIRVRTNPRISCLRYGPAKRPRRNSTQVEGGVWSSVSVPSTSRSSGTSSVAFATAGAARWPNSLSSFSAAGWPARV